MNGIVRVGSRESVLAVRQAELVIEAIKKSGSGIKTELVTIKTRGDKILDKRLDAIGGKGLFIKELEQALLEARIDIAVHSYKDMPYEETEDLPVVGLSEREAPFDALVFPLGTDAPDMSGRVGSSSLRRSIQLKELYNGVETADIRGNVLTRLDKLDKGGYSAIVLAQAGLIRLKLHHRISRVFTAEEMLPSASQGIIAVQGRRGEAYPYLSDFRCPLSENASKAERQFVRTLGGSCGRPVAAYAETHGNELRLSGMYVDDAERIFKGSMSGVPGKAEQIGEALAISLKEKAVKGWEG